MALNLNSMEIKLLKRFACRENCDKIASKYKGKVADDAVKYGRYGTT